MFDSYPLRGLLFCRCGQPLIPWGGIEPARMYLSVCGCRLRPLDASAVERRVYAEAASVGPGLVAGRLAVRPDEAVAWLFARIEVGGTVDDIRFVPR